MSDELKKAATSIWSDGQSQDSASASPSSKNLEAGLAVDVACTQQANDGHPNLVTRILSLVRTRECGRDHCPPPDGGRQAWTQVLLGHIVCVNSWGYINAFGVFQSYYTTTLSRPPSDVSWIGALQIFFLFFMATFSGRATDGGYFKFTWSLGAIITVVSLFLASLSRQYWQLLLSQGVLQGLGFGLMFCPMLALIPTYFERRRAVAITAIITGCGTGGLIFSLMTNELINRVGFPWAMRTLGFFTLATLLPGFFLLRQRLPPRKSGPVVEWRAFCELPYALFSIGMFLVLWGLYIGGILREQLRAGRSWCIKYRGDELFDDHECRRDCGSLRPRHHFGPLDRADEPVGAVSHLECRGGVRMGRRERLRRCLGLVGLLRHSYLRLAGDFPRCAELVDNRSEKARSAHGHGNDDRQLCRFNGDADCRGSRAGQAW